MKVPLSVVALLLAPILLSASQTNVTLKVLSDIQQTVRGVGVGMGDFGPTTTTPCSQPFPDDAIIISTTAAGPVSQCTFGAPASSLTGSVSASYVKAVLQTVDGSSFYVYMSCWKKYGACPALNATRSYPAKIGGSTKQFVDFVNRKEPGATRKLYLRIDGKTKVSYTIWNAAKAPTQP